jgi:hypothetical protein
MSSELSDQIAQLAQVLVAVVTPPNLSAPPKELKLELRRKRTALGLLVDTLKTVEGLLAEEQEKLARENFYFLEPVHNLCFC